MQSHVCFLLDEKSLCDFVSQVAGRRVGGLQLHEATGGPIPVFGNAENLRQRGLDESPLERPSHLHRRKKPIAFLVSLMSRRLIVLELEGLAGGRLLVFESARQ
ncbi:hypothetical protein [Symmachiella macrocystis]|uniref:hypothetical protein n=1 Tax=Symmachiella macrocystis TaxID=2527985 RepID=UPI0011B66A91|nr:hypothetical protein [Symmachiella macrocystis]